MRRDNPVLPTIAFIALLLGGACHAFAADMWQAREVARLNNCPVKKIEVYRQSLGTEGETIYHIDCNMPKATGETAAGPDALLVKCDETLCQLLQTLPAASGK